MKNRLLIAFLLVCVNIFAQLPPYTIYNKEIKQIVSSGNFSIVQSISPKGTKFFRNDTIIAFFTKDSTVIYGYNGKPFLKSTPYDNRIYSINNKEAFRSSSGGDIYVNGYNGNSGIDYTDNYFLLYESNGINTIINQRDDSTVIARAGVRFLTIKDLKTILGIGDNSFIELRTDSLMFLQPIYAVLKAIFSDTIRADLCLKTNSIYYNGTDYKMIEADIPNKTLKIYEPNGGYPAIDITDSTFQINTYNYYVAGIDNYGNTSYSGKNSRPIIYAEQSTGTHLYDYSSLSIKHITLFNDTTRFLKPIKTNSTINGRNISNDGTKLDSTIDSIRTKEIISDSIKDLVTLPEVQAEINDSIKDLVTLPEAQAEISDSTGVCVKLSGKQTIDSVKTFTSFPLTPSLAPTTDYQVANKKYVDDNSGGGGLLLDYHSVKTSGTDTTIMTVWKDLYTSTFTTETATTTLQIDAVINASMNGSYGTYCQITVNATPICAGGSRCSSSSTAPANIVLSTDVSVTGNTSYTVKLRWRVSSGQATIDTTVNQDTATGSLSSGFMRINELK